MNPGIGSINPNAGFVYADHHRVANRRFDTLLASDELVGTEPGGAHYRSLRDVAAEQITHRFLRSGDRQELIQMQIQSTRHHARAVLHRRFNRKRELSLGNIAASRTTLR